ncbi:hypothetical protein EYV94_27700 [Puteibacter caeruleilacunae]|nr:hypothetical protein EYV94_27700 [Puteibacter caeruleilacunae]
MKKDKVLFLIAITAVFFRITDVSAQKLSGMYVQDEMENIKLHLSEDLFLFEDDANDEYSAPYNCKDTLAFGYWKLDDSKSFLKLYTNPIQYAGFVNSSVEETVGACKDSIYLYIENPIETNYAKNNERSEDKGLIFYRINIETNDAVFDYEVNTKVYRLNTIVIKAPEKGGVRNIEISIHPMNYSSGWRYNMPPYFVQTLPYEPMNRNANIFKICIPELTVCYMSSLRLNGDFVKILNEHQLEWNGMGIYTRRKVINCLSRFVMQFHHNREATRSIYCIDRLL